MTDIGMLGSEAADAIRKLQNEIHALRILLEETVRRVGEIERKVK